MSTILVVDDSRTHRLHLKSLLGYFGHKVLEANNGAEALEILRHAPVHLLITDVLMAPMDGYEFLRRLRADNLFGQTPVIFYSAANFEPRGRAMAEALGVRHFLLKPAAPKEMLAAVNSALGIAIEQNSATAPNRFISEMPIAPADLIDPNAIVFVVASEPPPDLLEIVTGAGYKVKGFETAEEFLDQYDTNQPGCLVLGLRLRGMTGLALVESLRSRQIHIPIIILTAHGHTTAAVEAFRLGVMDFLEKPADPQILLVKIDRALQQDSINRRERAETEAMRERVAELTARERDLVKLLILGKSSREIAAELYISERTVAHHRAHIMAKLLAKNTADLVRIAMIAFAR